MIFGYRTPGDERGIAAVEFVIVLPVLLLFVAGIIELGAAFHAKKVLTVASLEGARVAVVYKGIYPLDRRDGQNKDYMVSDNDIKELVCDVIEDSGYDCTRGNDNAPSNVRVIGRPPNRNYAPIIPGGIKRPVTVTAWLKLPVPILGMFGIKNPLKVTGTTIMMRE